MHRWIWLQDPKDATRERCASCHVYKRVHINDALSSGCVRIYTSPTGKLLRGEPSCTDRQLSLEF